MRRLSDVPLVLALTLLLTLTRAVRAHRTDAYWHDVGAPTMRNADWMAELCDNATLSQLSLPGTHDSLSLYGDDSTVTQVMTLPQQLAAGVRVLDIRCRHINNRCAIHHGTVYQHAGLDDVLAALTLWLDAHPSELVLMRIRSGEAYDLNVTRSFDETFEDYLGRYPRIWRGGMLKRSTDELNLNPRVGKLRGSVVVLPDGFGWRARYHNDTYGLPYETLIAQDQFSMNTNWGLYAKWTAVVNHLRWTAASQPAGLFINYLSAAGAIPYIVMPYFVASGHVSASSDAVNAPTWAHTLFVGDGYAPDFPRVSCADWLSPSWCWIEFEGTNKLTMDWLVRTQQQQQQQQQDLAGHTQSPGGADVPATEVPAGESGGRVGIIMADFPGAGLINAVIARNGPDVRCSAGGAGGGAGSTSSA